MTKTWAEYLAEVEARTTGDFDGWAAVENPMDNPSVSEWCAAHANARLAPLMEALGELADDIDEHFGEPDWSFDQVSAVLTEYRKLTAEK